MLDYSKEVNWLVEEYINDDDPSLVNTLREKGYLVKILPHQYAWDACQQGWDWYVNNLFSDNKKPVVFHGSLQAAKVLSRWGGYTYKRFFNKESLSTLNYYSNEKLRRYLLNASSVYVPLWYLPSLLANTNGKVFIRPDSPCKEFTGQVVDYHEFDLQQFMRKNDLGTEDSNLLVMVANPKPLNSEVRFVVSRDEVLSASFYKKGEETIFESLPVSSEGNDFIRFMYEVLENGVLTDLIYQNGGLLTVDVGQVLNALAGVSYSIIEVGSFSTSSLYSADFNRVIDKASELAYCNEKGTENEEGEEHVS